MGSEQRHTIPEICSQAIHLYPQLEVFLEFNWGFYYGNTREVPYLEFHAGLDHNILRNKYFQGPLPTCCIKSLFVS